MEVMEVCATRRLLGEFDPGFSSLPCLWSLLVLTFLVTLVGVEMTEGERVTYVSTVIMLHG